MWSKAKVTLKTSVLLVTGKCYTSHTANISVTKYMEIILPSHPGRMWGEENADTALV